MKRGGLPTTALFLLIGLVVLIAQSGLSQAQMPGSTAARPQRSSASLTRSAYLPLATQLAPINPFGIVMYDNVDASSGLAQMQAAGARHVSTILDWGTIEPVEGARNWSSFDAKVSNARAASMSLFVLFTGDPQWAWTGPADNRTTDPQKRLSFVRAMIQRYDCDGVSDAGPGLCVRDWSFYAEPDYHLEALKNSPGAKGYWGRRGVQYAQMLRDVAVTVHVEDSSARVLIGGLAYDSFDTDGGPFVRAFLPTVLGELSRLGGASQFINAVAVHYYPIKFQSIRDKLLEVQGIMRSYGVGHLPLLVPEAGYWSQGDSTEQKQAQMLVRYYTEGLTTGAEQLSWFTVFDLGPNQNTWGLFRGRDLNSPKPSYVAYQNVTRRLAGAAFLQPLDQPGVTGYVFRLPDGSQTIVAWTERASGVSVTVPGACATVSDKLGATRQQRAASATTEAEVRVGLAAHEPVFISTCR